MRANPGFTIVELIFVIVISGILTSIAFRGLSGVQDSLAARGASQAYQAMHNTARARAVESGTTVLIVVWTDVDEVGYFDATSGVHGVVDFGAEYNVDIQTSGPSTNFSYYQCFTPMGYADIACGGLEYLGLTPIGVDFRVRFAQGPNTDGFLVLPLGQLIAE